MIHNFFLFAALFIISFNQISCTKNNTDFKEITNNKFKVSVPENWSIENDQDDNMIFMSHPELDYKYKIDLKWSTDKGIDDIQALNSHIDLVTKYIPDNMYKFNFDNKNGCKTKGEYTICTYEQTGTDIEGDRFLNATYIITKPEVSGYLEYSVRVSKPEFTKKRTN